MRMGKYLGSVKVSVLGAVLAVALAGCTEPTPTGGLPDPPSSAASSATESSATSSGAAPTTSAAPTTTYTPEEQAVIDQYKGYYQAFYKMSILDEASIRSAFEPYVTPIALDQLVTGLNTMASQDEQPAGSVTFGIINVIIVGQTATVVECRDTSTESIVSIADGSTKRQGGPGTRFNAELRLADDQRWKIGSAKGVDHSC